MARVPISNSSPLIAFSKVGRMDLLLDPFDEVLAPEAVIQEVGFRPSKVMSQPATAAGVIQTLRNDIDPGEAEVIALGTQIQNPTLIIDDARGRRMARSLGMHVVGSVGLVIMAKKEGRLTAAKPILKALVAAGLYLRPDLVHKVLAELGEVSSP